MAACKASTTYYLRTLNKSTIDNAGRERRPEAAPAVTVTVKREYTETEKLTCSIDAMRNGGTCEACQ